MRFFQRSEERHEPQGQQQPEGRAGVNLDELRLAGEELLAAGDEAISRILSGDSEAFLESTKQQGGE